MIITGDEIPDPSKKKPSDAPPKIILSGSQEEDLKADESWKEKAQREKERLAETQQEAEAAERQLPPASFLGLVEELAVRAMLALGQLRDPQSQEVYIDLDGAKYVVDTLQVLEQKTKGNLEPAEEQALKQLLHNLRLTFVHVSRAAAAALAAEGRMGPGAGGAAGPGGAGEGPPGKPGPKIIY